MAKAQVSNRTIVKTDSSKKFAQAESSATTPWACHHSNNDGWNIDAYVKVLGEWTTIAHALPVAGVDAKAVAEQIVRAVNKYEKHQELMDEMAAALTLCLECKSLPWEAEHDAEIILSRYQELKK